MSTNLSSHFGNMLKHTWISTCHENPTVERATREACEGIDEERNWRIKYSGGRTLRIKVETRRAGLKSEAGQIGCRHGISVGTCL